MALERTESDRTIDSFFLSELVSWPKRGKESSLEQRSWWELRSCLRLLPGKMLGPRGLRPSLPSVFVLCLRTDRTGQGVFSRPVAACRLACVPGVSRDGRSSVDTVSETISPPGCCAQAAACSLGSVALTVSRSKPLSSPFKTKHVSQTNFRFLVRDKI